MLGDLMRPVGDLVEQRTEKIVSGKSLNWPYLGLEHLAQGEPRVVGTAHSSTSTSTNGVFQSGDILFGKLRPYLQKSVQVDFPGYCSTDVMVFRAIEGTWPAFAAKVFQWESVFDEAMRTAEGTKMPRTAWGRLKHWRTFAPPLPEQRRIAEILDTADEAIRRSEALLAKLEEVKAGLLHDLLTRGLDKIGRLRDPEAHPEQFQDSPLGRIPREWAVKHLRIVADLQVGWAFKSDWFRDDPVEGARLLRGENVGYGVPDWKFTKWLPRELSSRFPEFLLSDGDAIIGMDRTFTGQGRKVSRIGLQDVPCLLVQRVGRFRPQRVDPGYLWLVVCSAPYGAALAQEEKGMDIPHLSREQILAPSIPLPPLPEQRRIAAILDSHDARIRAERAQLDKLRQIKKGLMHDLLTGKVRVQVPQEARHP